jgi:hypothetical protein
MLPFASALLCGQTNAGVKTAVTRAALNTVTGTQDFTVPGLGWTPKAAIFIFGSSTADATPTTNAAGSFGATDGTNQWVTAWCSSPGPRRTSMTGQVIAEVLGNSGATTISAAFDSFISNGVRINITDPGGPCLVTVVLFGGGDLTAKAGVSDLTTQNNAVTATPGFQTNALITAHSEQPFNSVINTNASANIGYASYDGTTILQGGDAHQFGTPGSVRSSAGAVVSTGCVAFNGAQYAELTSVTSTQFSLTSRLTNLTGLSVGWLALNFNGQAQAWVGVQNSPTATGSKDFTGASFTPSFSMFSTNRDTATATSQVNGEGFAWSVTPITASAQYCNHWRATDAAGSGGTVGDFNEADSKAINTRDHRSLNDIDATFTSFISGGVRMDFTAAFGTVLKWPALFIG